MDPTVQGSGGHHGPKATLKSLKSVSRSDELDQTSSDEADVLFEGGLKNLAYMLEIDEPCHFDEQLSPIPIKEEENS